MKYLENFSNKNKLKKRQEAILIEKKILWDTYVMAVKIDNDTIFKEMEAYIWR